MEAGVRIMKEDAQTGKRSYACHAYLTFVARAPPALPSTISSHLPWPLSELPAHPTSPSKPPPFQVPQVKPVTVLEHKRYLLAGRRRGHRMKRRQIWDSQLSSFRDYVLSFPASPHAVLESERMAGQGELKDIEMELVAEGYLKGDEDVRVEAGQVIAEVEGFMDRVSFPLKDVRPTPASSTTHSLTNNSADRKVHRLPGHRFLPPPLPPPHHLRLRSLSQLRRRRRPKPSVLLPHRRRGRRAGQLGVGRLRRDAEYHFDERADRQAAAL